MGLIREKKGVVGQTSMQAGEQPRIMKDIRQGYQGEVVAMRAAEASACEAAASTLSEVEVSDTSGAKLAAARGAEAAPSRAEAARAKARSTLVN